MLTVFPPPTLLCSLYTPSNPLPCPVHPNHPYSSSPWSIDRLLLQTMQMIYVLLCITMVQVVAGSSCQGTTETCWCCDAGKYGYESGLGNYCANCPAGKTSEKNCLVDRWGFDSSEDISCVSNQCGPNAKTKGDCRSETNSAYSNSISIFSGCECTKGSNKDSCFSPYYSPRWIRGKCQDLPTGKKCSSDSDCASGLCKPLAVR
jgi:hypothetical protein